MAILILLLLVASTCNGFDRISNYKRRITAQVNESLNYVFPKNAYTYQAVNQEKTIDFGTYDFVIIGAGSSGTVIANRLSEKKRWKILLLEPGGFVDDIIDIPNLVSSTRLSDYNWGYLTVPQTTCCQDLINKQCPFSRGKGVGGTSIINGQMYSQGNKLDFKKWEEIGNPGWSYDDVLYYFKKSEHFVRTDPTNKIDTKYHGFRGYANVEFTLPKHPLADVWLKANKELGFNYTDYNGKQEMGASIVQIYNKKGRRVQGGNAFIKPILHRKNLVVLTGSYVTKIVIDNVTRIATGVCFTRKGKQYQVRGGKEVILSAGAINSPQILMLSGVGPQQHLEKLKIPVIANLQVGQALSDHPSYLGLSFSANLSLPSKTLDKYIKDYFLGVGSLTYANSVLGIGFYRTKYESEENYPDVELFLFTNDQYVKTLKQQLSSAKQKSWQNLDDSKTFEIHVTALHTRSTGTVKLKSSNPFDYPDIDPRFISDENNIDINIMYEGIKFVLELIKTKPFMDINTTLVKQNIPACNQLEYLSEAYWKCMLPQFTTTNYHQMRTCPMGPKPENGDVVNYECKVHGIKQLRVADASVIPSWLTGHTNAPCVMIGEKVSDLIKSEYRRL